MSAAKALAVGLVDHVVDTNALDLVEGGGVLCLWRGAGCRQHVLFAMATLLEGVRGRLFYIEIRFIEVGGLA